MSLKKYLEYMTPKERQQAFKGGQSNLAGQLDEIKPTQPENPLFLQKKKDYYQRYGKTLDYVYKNKFSLDDSRICLLYSGVFYSSDMDTANHDMLAQKAFYDYQFPELMDKGVNWWWTEVYYLKFFVNLTYNTKHSKYIYLSESYGGEYPEEELQENEFIYNHYNQLCKKIFGKTFIAEALPSYDY